MKRQHHPAPISSVPPGAPRSARAAVQVDLVAALGTLVDLASELPSRAERQVVTSRVLDTVHELLPDHALGACVVTQTTEESFVELRIPPGWPAPGRDPTRLFPEQEHEAVIALPAVPGSTLHAAGRRATLQPGTAVHEVVMKTAVVLSGALSRAHYAPPSIGSASNPDQLRAQLAQADKLIKLGQSVAGIVHELANPLTSIVAYADLLRRQANERGADTAELSRLGRIEDAAQRILRFSKDLVAYARPTEERPSAVSLHDIIDKALVFCEHELSRHDIETCCRLEEGAPPVLGRDGPLTQVFVNLFTNAAYAMHETGGRLTIETHYDRGRQGLLVEIRDAGTGIRPESLPSIFEPFFTTKPRGEGTGLGLAIVRDIVETHGGTVSAASTPGEGTTFSVWLPVAPQE